MENLQYIFTHSLYWPWLAFWAVWLVAAMFVKQTAERQSAPSRLLNIALTVPAFFLLFDPNWDYGWLGRTFLPHRPAIVAAGLALTCAGLAFAVWARMHLGRNWSAAVTVKQGHTLVRSGPYRWTRHPIYVGMVVAALGSAVSVGLWRGLAGAALLALGFYYKSRVEEQMLRQAFGAAYDQ